MESFNKEDAKVAGDRMFCEPSSDRRGAVMGSREEREVSLTTDTTGGQESS